MTDAECVEFLRWALPRLRMRWGGFRRVRRQVCKRLARRLRQLDLADLTGYRTHLDTDPAEWSTLDAICRISISRFHRDRAVFDFLGDEVLPQLARGASALRCWCIGCAAGEEAYTLKILWVLRLRPRFPRLPLHIEATDADEQQLRRARGACFSGSSLKQLPADWRAAAFEASDGLQRLRPAFRTGITFRQEDVRTRLAEGPFDLILCRNLVFTYFEEPLQVEILQALAARLRRGGALVIGAHETLPEGVAGFEPWGRIAGIYRRARSG